MNKISQPMEVSPLLQPMAPEWTAYSGVTQATHASLGIGPLISGTGWPAHSKPIARLQGKKSSLTCLQPGQPVHGISGGKEVENDEDKEMAMVEARHTSQKALE